MPPRLHGAGREVHRDNAPRRAEVRHRKPEGDQGGDGRAEGRTRPADRGAGRRRGAQRDERGGPRLDAPRARRRAEVHGGLLGDRHLRRATSPKSRTSPTTIGISSGFRAATRPSTASTWTRPRRGAGRQAARGRGAGSSPAHRGGGLHAYHLRGGGPPHPPTPAPRVLCRAIPSPGNRSCNPRRITASCAAV